MGGGPNSTPPTDTPPGGGLPQYDYTGQFGNALGQGVSAFGKGYASGSNVPTPQFASPSVAPYVSEVGASFNLIPTSDPNLTALMQAFKQMGMI